MNYNFNGNITVNGQPISGGGGGGSGGASFAVLSQTTFEYDENTDKTTITFPEHVFPLRFYDDVEAGELWFDYSTSQLVNCPDNGPEAISGSSIRLDNSNRVQIIVPGVIELDTVFQNLDYILSDGGMDLTFPPYMNTYYLYNNMPKGQEIIQFTAYSVSGSRTDIPQQYLFMLEKHRAAYLVVQNEVEDVLWCGFVARNELANWFWGESDITGDWNGLYINWHNGETNMSNGDADIPYVFTFYIIA